MELLTRAALCFHSPQGLLHTDSLTEQRLGNQAVAWIGDTSIGDGSQCKRQVSLEQSIGADVGGGS